MQRILQIGRTRLGFFLLFIIGMIVAVIVLRQFELVTPRFPLGDGAEWLMDWAIIYLSPALEIMKLGLTRVFVGIEAFFLWIPWLVWVVFIGLLGWRVISLRTGLLVGGGLLLIELVELWVEAMSTVALVSTAMILTIIVAIPIGIIASRSLGNHTQQVFVFIKYHQRYIIGR